MRYTLILLISIMPNLQVNAMKTSKFQLNKLVRDKIPVHHDKNGSTTHLKPLDDQEFDKVLRLKLKEEIEEVCASKTKAELIEELADLFEVVDTLTTLHAITREEINLAQEKKRNERGGFHGRSFVTITEHPVGSQGEKYCRANPEKYREIIEK